MNCLTLHLTEERNHTIQERQRPLPSTIYNKSKKGHKDLCSCSCSRSYVAQATQCIIFLYAGPCTVQVEKVRPDLHAFPELPFYTVRFPRPCSSPFAPMSSHADPVVADTTFPK